MKNNKKLFLFGVVFVIVFIFIISLFFIISGFKEDELKSISVYYYDRTSNNIVAEDRKIKIRQDDFLKNIFEDMKITPKSANLKPVIPKNLNLLDYKLEDSILSINISNDYNNMSNIDKLIFRAGFVWTITELDFITNVKILVDNEEISYNNSYIMLNRNNMILGHSISPDKIEQDEFVLYFANNKNKLVEENRNVEFKQNKSKELHIVEELINGPKDDKNIKVIPSETKIRNIKTEDSICYVDLSADFINKLYNNSQQEELAIYSIVNSLTKLSNVNKVQLLIDGEKINHYNQKIDISKPIGYYTQIVEKSILNNLGDKED